MQTLDQILQTKQNDRSSNKSYSGRERNSQKKRGLYRAPPYIFTYIIAGERVPVVQRRSTRMGVSGAS